jgi:hypothetical protein
MSGFFSACCTSPPPQQVEGGNNDDTWVFSTEKGEWKVGGGGGGIVISAHIVGWDSGLHGKGSCQGCQTEKHSCWSKQHRQNLPSFQRYLYGHGGGGSILAGISSVVLSPNGHAARARICKLLWSPGIDSKESISPPM